MTQPTALTQNRLAASTSPYLRQHADNPVHWQPWDAITLAAARGGDRPILLSVGYAACHWCHVMARESFADPQIAALMNEHYICIKLDREERPDIDDIYMRALGLMGQQGGWPLTMFLLPDLRPFWGGTYFPKTAQYGQAGFAQVLQEVARAFASERASLARNSHAITAALQRATAQSPPDELAADFPHRAAQSLVQYMDKEHGGLGGAPKFPQAFLYQFIWQQARAHGENAGQTAVGFALERMCRGGLYDQLGGGFARYSTDARWLVPHFEKMLYDNALLIELAATLWGAQRRPLFARIVAESIGWLASEMRLEDGSFAASLDADTQGVEGKYYLWETAELQSLLGKDYHYFARVYGIFPQGNFEGAHILNRLHIAPEAEDDFSDPRHAACLDTLRAARAARPAPSRDDKSLADWNGLAVQALCKAARIFDRPQWGDLARTAYRAVLDGQYDAASGLIAHTRLGAQSGTVALGEDQVQMGRAALALYQLSGDADYLAHARARAASLVAHFHTEEGDGFYSAAQTADDLISRHAPIFDQAMPSLNGAALGFFSDMFLLSGEPEYRAQAEAIRRRFAPQAADNFATMTSYLSACHALAAAQSLVLIRPIDMPLDAPAYQALRRAIGDVDIVTLEICEGDALTASHPAAGKRAVDNRPTAYLCAAQSCRPPITDPDALRDALS